MKASKRFANQIVLTFAVAAFFIVVGLVGQIDSTIQQATSERYCDMVRTYRMTDGSAGWPDYENRYDRDCLDSPDPLG